MNATHEPIVLAAVDWGTSSLRIWGMSRRGRVIAERRTDEGMSRLERTEFEPVLRGHLQAIGATARNLRVIICGMAGARQGWHEAGYVDIPVEPDAMCAEALWVPAVGIDVGILPGLCDRRPGREDVMRGEETQLLGLLLEDRHYSGLVCLPGTHTKWVTLEGGQVTGFHTTMTGELFALLSQHSVLRHSMAGATPSNDPQSAGFQRGFHYGLGLISGLFTIRAAGLLRDVPPDEAADTLSGMLIGAEVRAVSERSVTLIASGGLATLYAGALKMHRCDVHVVDATAAVQRGLLYAARRLWPGLLA